jgi:hypothetical protein
MGHDAARTVGLPLAADILDGERMRIGESGDAAAESASASNASASYVISWPVLVTVPGGGTVLKAL